MERAISIETYARGLAEKRFSAEEVVSEYLARIRENDGAIKSFLFVDESGALTAARAADAAIGRGETVSPLLGVPIAVKDNILVSGMPSTAASKILEPYLPAYEATAAQKLRAAGAVIIGKTNLDEFAMGSSTENSAYGATKNPRDISRVPGGSSGGSAAAVAADFAIGALGSDTGGSIRQPAAFTGTVGLKPTYGRVSRHGLIAMASSLDQIGPIAKTVRDAAIIYEAIAGVDRYDATSASMPVESPQRRDNLSGVRIGAPQEYFQAGLDPKVKIAIENALKLFEKEGAVVKEISLPCAEYALPVYYVVMFAEASANLARFDGLRYGFRSGKAAGLEELYAKTRAEGFGAEVKRRVMLGTYVLSHGYYDAYYLKAQKVRRLIREDFEKAFTGVDVIMGPTTPSVAFPFGAKSAPVSMYLEDIYTVPVNLAGVPAVSIPCGDVDEGGAKLPVGLQIIGSRFGEARLLGIAEGAENALNQNYA